MFFKSAFDDNKIIQQIYHNDRVKRYTLFIIGVLLQAVAFNVFILQSNMAFGVSGIAVVLNEIFGITPAYIILVANLLLIVASFVYLGKNVTSKTIVGSLLYPLLVELTVFLPNYVDLGTTEPVIVALSGAVLYGVGTGLVFKAGYTTGGSDVIKQIISEYGKKSIGQATIYVEGIVVTLCLFVFGWQSFIYSIISLFVISMITDNVILGISKYKTLQIITIKEREVKQFIFNKLTNRVTS